MFRVSPKVASEVHLRLLPYVAGNEFNVTQDDASANVIMTRSYTLANHIQQSRTDYAVAGHL